MIDLVIIALIAGTMIYYHKPLLQTIIVTGALIILTILPLVFANKKEEVLSADNKPDELLDSEKYLERLESLKEIDNEESVIENDKEEGEVLIDETNN